MPTLRLALFWASGVARANECRDRSLLRKDLDLDQAGSSIRIVSLGFPVPEWSPQGPKRTVYVKVQMMSDFVILSQMEGHGEKASPVGS
jgi:hypothetical protein